MTPDLKHLPTNQPVLIAGPTAAGKSALALRIAEIHGGCIINADALQVYANWRILSARPSSSDEKLAPHHLYGHLSGDTPYSVGHWLREVTPLLSGANRPIIVGGTGLYFSALTKGLASIPPIPSEIREYADTIGLPQLLADLDTCDPVAAHQIDRHNRARVQRAWEVFHATNKPLSQWQSETSAPLLPPTQAACFVINAERDWLNTCIEHRVDLMLQGGVLEEAQKNLSDWHPDLPSSKCIGAAELIAYLKGSISLDDTRKAIIIATRQYAKRQRTWFRARMKNWIWLEACKIR